MNKLENYIPILRTKSGELTGIKNLTERALSRITPLLDFHRPKDAKDLQKQIDDVIHKLNFWPEGKALIYDCALLDLDWRMNDGLTHPVKYIANKLMEKNISFIPTIGLDRDSPYLEAIKEILIKFPKCELAIRFLSDDFVDLEESNLKISELLKDLKRNFSNCHLIIDFKFIEEKEIDSQIEALSELNQHIDNTKWKSFVVTASGFPTDMSNIPANTIEMIQRVEFNLWQAILIANKLVGRNPKFGDYVIVNPRTIEINPRTMRASAKIRYTTKDGCVIFRGHGLHLPQGEKFFQYHTLSKQVLNSEFFLGKDYSWGDDYIEKCANEEKSRGNLQRWIEVDTNHHLTLVGEQIANLSENIDIH